MSLSLEKTFTIEEASPGDAPEIHALQRLAYQSEAKIENDFTIPPLRETCEQVEAAFAEGVVFKVVLNRQIIASARTIIREGTCSICRVIVHPDHQNQGIGSRLMRAVENRFPEVERFRLYTSGKSGRNLHFYDQLGYSIYKTVEVKGRGEMVHLEKHS